MSLPVFTELPAGVLFLRHHETPIPRDLCACNHHPAHRVGTPGGTMCSICKGTAATTHDWFFEVRFMAHVDARLRGGQMSLT